MNIDAIAAVGVLVLVALCIIAEVVNDVRTTKLIALTTLGFGKVALDMEAREREIGRANRAINNLNKDVQENLDRINATDARVDDLEGARLYDIFAQRLADGTFREEHVAPRRAHATKVSTRKRRAR